ncbi:MAG TPA: mechanosensitive ion channel domain-containing protein [Dokdonella sp.]|uniref:mechanosensitive ion channel family protein n=1 Tax=Dokdonella sp. TaxID=2291710 RepID=UPI002D7E3CBD|nr:mechanosensitive ion channel domain-containing protein [Dokdonella sp.]HET9033042.1 mechanosensitive ion channel domain-containing protein [Dokdonella sp.]
MQWLMQPQAQMISGLSALILLAWLAATLTRRLLVRGFRAMAARTAWTWDDIWVEHGALRYLSRLVPTLVIQFGIGFVAGVPDELDTLIRSIALAGTILFLILAIGATLDSLEEIYRRGSNGTRSIKTYIQFLKIAVYIIGAVVIISTLINRSPLILLSGLGALSAILLLVFKDTILGLVAGMQLTSNDMLRVGDWIEVPGAAADGDVIDIALHTVKVQNWDKTITTIPTWKLIADPFKNWRGMSEAGGRRIKRSLLIDAGSVHFIGEEDISRMAESTVLRDYLNSKSSEVSSWNSELGDAGRFPLNQRRLTNLGTLRAYALSFLKTHPGIHQDMTLIVRQLAASGEGIPLELYCFTKTTAWSDYEGIVSDIFDHMIAILPEFGLRLYQKPAGSDLREAIEAVGTREAAAEGPRL